MTWASFMQAGAALAVPPVRGFTHLGQARAALKLDASSRVFAVVTEGATDPERYAELVGLTPAEVAGTA